jgi:hypothetical protein
VLVCSFCFACLAYTTLAANVTFHFAPPPAGPVVGWTTVNAYPKQQETFYYLAGVVFVPLVALGLTLAWWRIGARLGEKFRIPRGTVFSATALAFVPVLYEGYKLLRSWPPIGYGQLRRAIVSLVVAYGLALLYCRYCERIRRFIFSPANFLYSATVLLSGTILGCYLPFLFPRHPASALADLWWVAPVLCWAIWARFSLLLPGKDLARAEHRAQNAALAFMPLALLLAYPFLFSSYWLTIALMAMAAGTCALLWTWRATAHAVPSRTVFHGWNASVLAIVLATANMAANPHFQHGIVVSPLDGDHIVAWFFNGLHGQLPYRDFFYPYGPLQYYHNLLSARLFGLDNFQVPAAILGVAILGLLLYRTASVLYETRIFLIAGPLAMLWYWQEPRVFLGFAAVLLTAQALEERSTGRLRWAGLATGVAWLYSVEVGTCAVVTTGALTAFHALGPENGGRRLQEIRKSLASQLAGAAFVLVPAGLIGLVTGTLGPYVREIYMHISVASQCCVIGFPNIFHVPRAGLLKSDIFRIYYFAPLTYVIALVYLGWQWLERRRLASKDIAALGVLLFGGLLFKTALTRSDEGHLMFASLPAVALLSALLDRTLVALCSVFTGCQDESVASDGGAESMQPKYSPRFRNVIYGVFMAAFLVAGVTVTTPYKVLPRAMAAVVNTMRNYYMVRFTDPQRYPGMVPLRNPEGTVFLFPPSTAPHVEKVKSYLQRRLAPGETTFCLPFVARYYFLLGQPTPPQIGPSLWVAAATPQDQQKVVGRLEQLKPVYVVYDEAEWPDADGVPWIDRFPEVMQYLFLRYRVEEKIDSALILRRSEEPPLPPRNIASGELENQLYLSRGWYHIESSGPAVGRWTTSDATALVTRKPGDNALTLTASAVGTDSQNLTVSINGVAVARQPILPGWQTYEIDLPDSLPSKTVNTVEFRTDAPFQPAAPRQLGIFVKSFGFGHVIRVR